MKHPLLNILICLLCASAPLALGRAEVLSTGDSIVASIDKRVDSLDSLIFIAAREAAPPDFLLWSVDEVPDSDFSATIDAITRQKIKAFKAQSGLQLTGQVYYRPIDALTMDEEDDVSRYIAKAQVEMRWYFLQSGLLNRRGRANELNLKADLDRLQHEHDRGKPDIYINRERLRVVSDSILASIMLYRVDNLVLLEDAYMYLLENNNISSDNLLRILDDRAEAERRLSSISTMPVKAESLESVVAGTITIDTTVIIDAIAGSDLDLQILDVKSKILEQKAHNTTWWSDVRLAPFVRYSYYLRAERPASSNVDVGLSFTIPLDGDAAHTRKALLAEKDQLDFARDNYASASTEKVRYLALEVERVNRAIVGEWERAASLRRYLRLRRNAYNKRKGEYNHLNALMEYNSYLRCLENIIELQYKRDSFLLDMQALAPSLPLINYCTFTLLK